MTDSSMSIQETSIRDCVGPVAFHGMSGAFGEDAVISFGNGRATPVPCTSFSDALDAVLRGDVRWAVIPVWNSTVGRITSACAELQRRRDAIQTVRYIDVPVKLCLVAAVETTVDELRYVASHPAALAQCKRLFARHSQLMACEASDTANAARQLAALITAATARPAGSSLAPWYAALPWSSTRSLGAIASARAARRYRLVVLRENVQDNVTNFTRFAAVRRRE